MKYELKYRAAAAAVSAIVLASSPRLALAQTEVPNPGDGPNIWLDFVSGGDPVSPQHFTVDFSDESFPSTTLIEEALDWRIWSVDTDNPGDIGDIGDITCPRPGNFFVEILDDSDGPGARDVKGIVLDPSNAEGRSTILEMHITGDLLGDLFVRAVTGGSSQGDLRDVQIDGSVQGNIDAFRVRRLVVNGDAEGTITVDVVFAWPAPFGWLEIKGDTLGDVTFVGSGDVRR